MIKETLHLLVLCMTTLAILSTAVAADLGKEIFSRMANSAVSVTARDPHGDISKSGGGVIFSDTTVLTNCHVLKAPGGGVLPEIVVRQPLTKVRPQKSYAMQAELLEDIGDQDLCLLHVDKLPYLPGATEAPLGKMNELAVGTEICAIGRQNAVVCGVISQFRSCRDMQAAEFEVPCGEHPDEVIQTDMDVFPGFSGSGVFAKSNSGAIVLVGVVTFRHWIQFEQVGQPITMGPAYVLPVEWVMRSPVYDRIQHKKVKASAKEQDFLRAKQLAQQIYHADKRALALVYIARKELKAGDVEGALETLGLTLPVVDNAYLGSQKYASHVGILIRIATLYRKAESEHNARNVLHTALRVTEAAYEAHKQNRHRYSHYDHARLLAKIARAQWKLGDAEEAREIINHAFQVSLGMEFVGPASRADRLRDIACTQVEMGDTAGAAETRRVFERNIRAARPGGKVDRIRRRMSRCGA